MNLSGAMTEVETLRKALSEAEDKAAKERTEHEKQEARVDEVQQELQDFIKNTSPWSVTLRRKSPSLLRPSRAREMPKLKPKRPSRRLKWPRRYRRVRHSLCKASMRRRLSFY